ncbi:hypothetical protein AV530_016084 [Patagioenas fasciata monilis]|uniref:Uncharacterized protein n=1 Tax=Patagioenas fasciata monilis TaxID=372326 RepID=A0A1V4KK13_PATFA|nr:hypothetical protein AV530_016084 [Patagioenas fasciata monilis]
MGSRLELPEAGGTSDGGTSLISRADPIPSSQLLAEEQNHKEEATSKPRSRASRDNPSPHPKLTERKFP